MKIALIHDWYYTNGGAEKVIKALSKTFPDCEHFALFDVMSDTDKLNLLNTTKVNTTFIQKMPFISKFHRKYLQLYPYAIEQLDLRSFDLIISSSSAVARSEEHTSELQSRENLVCRLLLEKKNYVYYNY